MRRAVRLLFALVLALATITLAWHLVLTHTARSWFEDDLALRSELAVGVAQRGLLERWSGGRDALGAVLDDIARDERVLSAAVCGTESAPLATTAAYPSELSCRALAERMQGNPPGAGKAWAATYELPGGAVHVSAIPVDDAGEARGLVVLVQDLSYFGQREAATRNILIAAFFALALGASALTLLSARIARRDWTRELRHALTGKPTSERKAATEFQPLIRDLRRLAEHLSRERDHEATEGAWSPRRLRSTLSRYLQGERIVILANREPYVHEKSPDGIRVLHPASGLVTALEPVMRACSGVWVAHGSGSADRETVDAHDRVRVPPGEDSYLVRRVWLSDDEENGYYYGFSNEGLWPLCHVAHTRPLFRAQDFDHYMRVNQKFADAVCEEVDSDDPIVLIQDYHFALAPRMIRERLPRATILTFWHIPWPNAERIGICPWREELISGLLGSSILGFHTKLHCNNFIDAVDAFMESRIDREENAVFQGERRTLVRPYPISIDWPVRWTENVPPVSETRLAVRRELGFDDDLLLGVGVDRLDYTKGIEERLSAVDDLLQRYPQFRGKFSFLQLAAPSRTKIPHYRDLNERVESLAAEINARWGTDGYRPIVLLRTHHQPAEVFRYYRAADLCYVSSLHDGMNLVAKEFVAARDDEAGVLVLSQFTGAARELTEALVVNPYDLRQASDALATALAMPLSEQRERMRSMRRLLSEFNVYRWAGRMLVDAAEVRRKERLSGRFESTRPEHLPESA